MEGEERKNVCSLFSLALEATENSSLHFSCQAVALLMVCSQSVVRQKGGGGALAGTRHVESQDKHYDPFQWPLALLVIDRLRRKASISDKAP